MLDAVDAREFALHRPSLCGRNWLPGARLRARLGFVEALIILAGLLVLSGFWFWVALWTEMRGWKRWGVIGIGVLLGLIILPRFVELGDEVSDVEDVLERVATTTDPSYCDEDVTQLYLEATTGGEAPYADELCESYAGQPAADWVTVKSIDIEGSRATAVVEQHGGSFDGSHLVKELVKEDGDWKLDKVLSFATFDRRGFEEAYRKSFIEFASSRAAVACAMGRVSKMSNAEIKTDVLSDDLGAVRWLPVICDRQGVVDGYIETLRDDPASPRPLVACAEERFPEATDGQLVRFSEDLIAYERFLADCGEPLLHAYTARALTQGDIGTQQANCVAVELEELPIDEAIRLGFEDERYEDLIDACG